MKKMSIISAAATLLCCTQHCSTAQTEKNDFSSLWYDGNAEISVYSLSEMRYGELREGRRIMVFVTEPMRLSTHIKPDSPLPEQEKIDVIKLNDLRKFATGIYEYSVMTSVFTAVEEKPSIPRWATMKTALTSQEWCGLVFERAVRTSDTYTGVLYSYFESEGETTYSFPVENNFYSEETLWLLVRELQGEIFPMNKPESIRVVPSMWTRRKTHEHVSATSAIVVKKAGKKVTTPLGTYESVVFSWTIGEGETTVWVESAYPHKILKWTEPDGSQGHLITSRREPYWKQNSTKHDRLRKDLKLPDF